MDSPKPLFKLNTRVKLRDGVDPGFYNGYSRAGNEAWIRDRKIDNLGYPRVFIEWDKDHWSYNGAPDIWTWEPHFEPVEENMSKSKDDNIMEALKDLVSLIRSEEDPKKETKTEEVEEVTSFQEESKAYAERLEEVLHTLKDSRAYVVIAIPEEDPEQPLVYPHIYHDAQQENLELICQAQLAEVNAAFQGQLISQRLRDNDEG